MPPARRPAPRIPGRAPAGQTASLSRQPDPRLGLLALQRGAGNQAVQQLARQLPKAAIDYLEREQRPPDLSPGKFAERHPEWGAATTSKPAPGRATRSDATSYESQPEALREVLERSWGEAAFSQFRALSDQHRALLITWYNRMLDYELWGHVRRVTVVLPGERPVALGPVHLQVQGLSASIRFEVYDGRALRNAMLSSERFGKDVGASGLLHPGQTSMREWARTTTDGMHLSIDGGTDADVHMDKRSPTDRPHAGETRMDWMRSWEHHWQEVWPEFERKVPGWIVRLPQYVLNWLIDKTERLGTGKAFRDALKAIPRAFFEAAAHAVGVFDAVWAGNTIKPGEDIEDKATRPKGSWIVILKEYRFGAGKGRPAGRPITAPAGQKSLTAEVAKAVRDAVTRTEPGVVRATGLPGDQDDFAATEEVGEALARLILHRAAGGGAGATVGIDLGALYEQLTAGQVDEVKQQLARIGAAVREALAAALEAKHPALAEQVRLVRSAVTPLGGTLVTFPLH